VSGLLELTDSETEFGAMTVKCEDILDGTVGPGKEDLIETVLNLAGELINEFGEAPELPLHCESVAGCEKTTEAEVWPKNIYPNGWKTQLELMSSEPEFLDHLFAGGIGKEPGYEMRCLVGGVNKTDFCEGLTTAKVENITAEKDVLEIFNPAAPISSQLGSCELGGTGAGELLDEYLIFLESGLGLTVNGPPSWLVDGNEILDTEGALAFEIEWSLVVTDLKGSLGSPASIDCEGFLVGNVGAHGLSEIIEVLSLAGEKIGTALTGTALKCEAGEACAHETDITLWVDNLPWLGENELMSSEPTFLDHLFAGGAGKELGYEFLCLVFGLNITDLCEGLTSVKLENTGEGDVLAFFNPEAPISSEKGTCEIGGAGTGDMTGEGLVLLVSGKALSVS
jgi:hypothetical protein